jgi:RimJ/RimL family protein N-acetyltransferase
MEDPLVLTGVHIRLEPLGRHHAEALTKASAGGASLYRWSPVPQSLDEANAYVETALAWRDAGTALPFAIVRLDDGAIIGSSRFWNIERWSWPRQHPRHARSFPDACEIGYSWLAASAIRTPANTEAKQLMLTRAFESWQALRVCFHTDSRNDRSRAALERIGAKFEGVLRGHRMAADFIPRDSLRFSIIATEWPEVRKRLNHLLLGQRA